MGLIQDMLNGQERALSRLLTILENNPEKRKEILRQIHPYTGKAHIIGITGPPGAGKSTLMNELSNHLIAAGKSVGIIAVDPSSPFSKGAILGDRIRMDTDPGSNLYYRSLASRGNPGGLSRVTNDSVKLLDSFGKDIILIETVGIGQTELDITSLVHTTVIVLAPGFGDHIQAMKSGILEAGDIYVINKADLEGAQRTYADIQSSTRSRFHDKVWQPPVIQVISTEGTGINKCTEAFSAHFRYLHETGEIVNKEKARLNYEVRDYIFQWTETVFSELLTDHPAKKELIDQLYAGPGELSTKLDHLIRQIIKEEFGDDK